MSHKDFDINVKIKSRNVKSQKDFDINVKIKSRNVKSQIMQEFLCKTIPYPSGLQLG